MKEKVLHAEGVERLCAIAPVGLCYIDADLRYRFINEWLARMNGLPVEVHAGKRIDELVTDVAAGILSQMRRVLETGEPIIDGEVEAETPAHPGEPRFYRHSYYPDISEDGTVKGISCVVRDVTDEKRAERALAQRNEELAVSNERLTTVLEELKRANTFLENEARRASQANEELIDTKTQLERLALYDTLTGLGNRNLFLKQLEHLISIAKRTEEEVALLAMDLDGFKAINDQLGHAGGDEVLREVSARLSHALRQADQKYRIGGDEFTVLLAPRKDAFDGAIALAKKIAKHIAAPMKIKGHNCSVGVSIGVSVFPQHGEDPDSLLRNADAAMYEAKKGNQVVAGASDLGATTVLKRLSLES